MLLENKVCVIVGAGSLRGIGYEAPEVTSFGTAQSVLLRLPIIEGQAAAGASTRVFDAICASEPASKSKSSG